MSSSLSPWAPAFAGALSALEEPASCANAAQILLKSSPISAAGADWVSRPTLI